MQLIVQIDEERKNKALIQASLGLSIVLHLLILGVVVSESTDIVDVDDAPRAQPLIVKLQEPTHAQTPPRAQTTNSKALSLQREWHPEPQSLGAPSTEVDATPREKSTVGRFNQHVVIQAQPSETRQTEAHESVAPELNQKQTAIPDIEGAPNRDLYGLARDFIQQEAREDALRKSRQNELGRQGSSIMRAPPPSITDKPGESDEPRSAFADALETAIKESQKYVIALPISKNCVFGLKRFDREQAEHRAQREAEHLARTGPTVSGKEGVIFLDLVHCKN